MTSILLFQLGGKPAGGKLGGNSFSPPSQSVCKNHSIKQEQNYIIPIRAGHKTCQKYDADEMFSLRIEFKKITTTFKIQLE